MELLLPPEVTFVIAAKFDSLPITQFTDDEEDDGDVALLLEPLLLLPLVPTTAVVTRLQLLATDEPLITSVLGSPSVDVVVVLFFLFFFCCCCCCFALESTTAFVVRPLSVEHLQLDSWMMSRTK